MHHDSDSSDNIWPISIDFYECGLANSVFAYQCYKRIDFVGKMYVKVA